MHCGIFCLQNQLCSGVVFAEMLVAGVSFLLVIIDTVCARPFLSSLHFTTSLPLFLSLQYLAIHFPSQIVACTYIHEQCAIWREFAISREGKRYNMVQQYKPSRTKETEAIWGLQWHAKLSSGLKCASAGSSLLNQPETVCLELEALQGLLAWREGYTSFRRERAAGSDWENALDLFLVFVEFVASFFGAID